MAPCAFSAAVEIAQVAGGNRLDVGGQDGGAGPFVFAPFAGDLVAGHSGNLGPEAFYFGEKRLFMGGVGVAVEEADRHRLDPVCPEPVEDRGHPAEVERRAFSPLVGDPPRHLGAEMAGHEDLRFHVVEVEEIGPVAARDLQRVAEPFGGDQPDLDALAFGQRVDDHRGAVGHEIHIRRCDPALGQHAQHAGFEVGRRGVGFGGGDLHPVRSGFESHQIGEGPADIRCNTKGPGHDLSSSVAASRNASAPGSFRASEAATRSGV